MPDERETQRRTVLETLELGEVRRGVVSALTNFGIFVDLGGLDGLVSAGDPALTRLAAAGRNCAKGDPLTVRVCNINLHRRQIRLRVVETPQ
ncbi:S1 RNA-binding domain-containing protein [Streptodolium elevatio]